MKFPQFSIIGYLSLRVDHRLRAGLIFLGDSKVSARENCLLREDVTLPSARRVSSRKQFSRALVRFTRFTIPKKNKGLLVV